MIVIQDSFGTDLMVNGNDATFTQMDHQEFLDELTAVQNTFKVPLYNLMQGRQPAIQTQIQNRVIAQFLATLVNAPQIPCVAQYSKVVSVSDPVFVYVIQPLAAQVTNFKQHTAIWKIRLTPNRYRQQG